MNLNELCMRLGEIKSYIGHAETHFVVVKSERSGDKRPGLNLHLPLASQKS